MYITTIFWSIFMIKACEQSPCCLPFENLKACEQSPCCLPFENLYSDSNKKEKSKIEYLKELNGKSLESAVKITISSEAVRKFFKEDFSLDSAVNLFAGQHISAGLRNFANDEIDDPIYKCTTHAAIQAGRNIYRGSSIISGAIDGAGYCVTSEISKKYKENGKDTLNSLAVNIAGTYLTEITENLHYCLAVPAACKLAVAKGVATATIVSAMQAYEFFTQEA